MTFGGRNVHAQKIDRLARRREAQAGIGEHHHAQGDQQDGNNGFGVHIGLQLINRLRSAQTGLPAGDDPDQHDDDGDDEEDMDEAAHRGAGHQPEQPQDDQDHGDCV